MYFKLSITIAFILSLISSKAQSIDYFYFAKLLTATEVQMLNQAQLDFKSNAENYELLTKNNNALYNTILVYEAVTQRIIKDSLLFQSYYTICKNYLNNIDSLRQRIDLLKNKDLETTANTIEDLKEIISHEIKAIDLQQRFLILASEAIAQSNNSPQVDVVINNQIVDAINLSLIEFRSDSSNIGLYNGYDFDFFLEKVSKQLFSYPSENKEILENNSNTDLTQHELITQQSNAGVTPISIKETTNNNNSIGVMPKPTSIEPKIKNIDKENPPHVKKENTAAKSKTNPTNNSTSIQTPAASGSLIYRVQIAAAREPVPINEIKKRYKGSYSVKEFSEEGWYKYYIAECKTLQEAILIRNESNVADAFIMAYIDGKKVKPQLRKSIPQTSIAGKQLVDLRTASTEKLIVVVQFRAARTPLNEEEIQEYYNEQKEINYIFEDGWHKYSFGLYSNFWAANKARKAGDIQGSFVVAYKDGIKYDLWSKTQK